jgi:alkylation response protein AidB-like acyl-CoA dehydrogenase
MAIENDTRSASGGRFLAAEALDACVARIAEESRAINDDRQVPQPLIDSMADDGLFRLLVPRSVGGEEIDFLEYLSIVQAISRADASVGWCFNQNNVLGTMGALMPEAAAKEVWSDPNAILCNGPPQQVTITPVDGGYSLSGRWNFSSGSRHATWAIAIGRTEDGRMVTMLMPKGDVKFIDVWQVNGLRGTGSFSFEVKDYFVPAGHAWVEKEPSEREPGPLYLIPRALTFAAGFASVALGTARGALDILIEVAQKKTPQESTLLREQQSVQRDVGVAEALWGSSLAFLTSTASKLWEHACQRHSITVEDRIQLRLASTHAIRKAAEATDIAYSTCGAGSIFESNPIQRKFQDAHAITQQIQGRMEHYETAGQFLMGLEPKGRFF